MKVSVVQRTNGGWDMHIRQIEIPNKCPVCGELRGKPYNYNFCEEGEWFSCDRWDNPCGHIDYYPNVLKEAESEAGE